MQIGWRAFRLTARMGFRHPHVPALFRHLLATLPLGGRHFGARQHTSHDWQRSQYQRQSENANFDKQFQHDQFIYNLE